MKRIGFIDYYLDEWHANNYPQWLRDDIKLNNRDFELAYAWADIEVPGKMGNREWCEKNSVEMLNSIEEIVDKSDCIVILSPDNAEQHERLAQIPLKSGKPVFIDKTFSPDYLTGVRMFDLANKNGTPLFSSSALRFGKELSDYRTSNPDNTKIEYVSTIGSGNYEIYSVHQLEMIISLLGVDFRRIKSHSTDNKRLFVIEYSNGQYASMSQASILPYQVSIITRDGKGKHIDNNTDMFSRLIGAILNFFDTRTPPVSAKETLGIMALRDAGFRAQSCNDKWITI